MAAEEKLRDWLALVGSFRERDLRFDRSSVDLRLGLVFKLPLEIVRLTSYQHNLKCFLGFIGVSMGNIIRFNLGVRLLVIQIGGSLSGSLDVGWVVFTTKLSFSY